MEPIDVVKTQKYNPLSMEMLKQIIEEHSFVPVKQLWKNPVHNERWKLKHIQVSTTYFI